MDQQSKNVLVLTDKPALYGSLLSEIGKTGTFFSTALQLNKALISDIDCCGIILDVKLVMATDSTDRNRLFALAAKMPIVRSSIDLANNPPTLLDPLSNLSKISEVTHPAFRIEERITVQLKALWSNADGPVMVESLEGVLLDISAGGAFMHTPRSLPPEDYMHLKILGLSRQRPIHCAVRWRRAQPSQDQLAGVGLKFIDLTPDQLDDIHKQYLEQPADY